MDKLKVLFLAADPAQTSKRALDDQRKAIEAKVRSARERDRLDFVSHWSVLLDELSGLLLHHQPHVVHYSGGVISADSQSSPPHRHVSTEALARLLRVLKDNVQVVLLDATETDSHAREIAKTIRFAIGMGSAFRDEHAIPFAAEFYQALAYGRTIQEAFDLGIVRLENEGCKEARDLVRLHHRADLDPARAVIFEPPKENRPEGWLPDLPQYALPREDEVRRVKQALLGNAAQAVAITAPRQSTTIRTTNAIRGMGGAGKSVLANLVARDGEIQRHFCDGILWVTVGQEGAGTESKAKVLQANLAKRLGETLDADSLDQGKYRLREWFAIRACLIILDDVWDPVDAQRLEVVDAGTRSRILITTREGTVVTRLKAEEIRLDRLSTEQAIQLLSHWYGEPVDSDDDAVEVAKECGYLPLALAVCGAMARDGNSWADIAEGLRQADLSFLESSGIDPKHESVLRSIDASVNHLESSKPDLARRYRDLAVFSADESVPESVVAMLWAETKYLPHQARLELSTLESKSLLTLEGNSPNRRVSLHDLQHDYVKGTHTALKDAHQKLLQAYHDRCGGVWANQEDDGYFFQHLLDHLRAADRETEVRSLLVDSSWVQAKLKTTGLPSLCADYEPYNADGAIRLSAPQLARDPALLRSQLCGRLVGIDSPETITLLESIRNHPPWLRPLTRSLNRPGLGLIQNLVGHTDWVRAVAVTQDGHYAVSASSDHTLKLWDLETNTAKHTLRGHSGSVLAVAVTHDARRAVSASADRTLRIWDLETGVAISTLEGHKRWVLAVAVTHDGRRAVSASEDGTLRVWELESGALLRTLAGPEVEDDELGGRNPAVSAVAVTPDDRSFISASDDRTLKIWDMESGALMRTLEGHVDEVRSVSIATDGRRAISASSKGSLILWDLELGTAVRDFQGHSQSVDSVVITPDGRYAVSASDDRTLRIWELATGLELRTLSGHSGWVTAVAVTSDGRRIISASRDGTLRVWSIVSDEASAPREHVSRAVNAVTIFSDGRYAISASEDRTLTVWDPTSGRVHRTLSGHVDYVRAVVVIPVSQRAVSASDDHTLILRDLLTGVSIRTFEGHAGAVNAVAVTQDGRRAVSASSDRTLKLWDLETGDEIRTLEGHIGTVNAVAVTHDGRRAVSASDDSMLKLWDLETGAESCTLGGHAGRVRAVAVMSADQVAVSASDDGTLNLWNLETGAEIGTLDGHAGAVNAVAVTPDGRRAVSASDDGTLRLWDLETGVVHATFAADFPLRCCAVSPDGHTIVAGDSGGRVHFLRWEGA